MKGFEDMAPKTKQKRGLLCPSQLVHMLPKSKKKRSTFFWGLFEQYFFCEFWVPYGRNKQHQLREMAWIDNYTFWVYKGGFISALEHERSMDRVRHDHLLRSAWIRRLDEITKSEIWEGIGTKCIIWE